jgi:hypothetical protein
MKSWDSSVGISADYGLEDPGKTFPLKDKVLHGIALNCIIN